MLICKLTISYERGLARNDERDLGLEKFTPITEDGYIVRGLGTHFKSADEMKLVKERDQEAARIRNAFKGRFLATPIDGCYIVSQPGEAKGFILGMSVRPDIRVLVTEFSLESSGRLEGQELVAWSNRIKNQLNQISVGRKKDADEEGLTSLETLAGCPVIAESTANRIRELVAMVREKKMERVELKRSLETLTVDIEQGPLLAPRRVKPTVWPQAE